MSSHPRGFGLGWHQQNLCWSTAVFHIGGKNGFFFFFFSNRQIALGKSSNSKCAHPSPYIFKIITQLHFCRQKARAASMQRAWKKSMNQETWARSFNVLHSRGAGRAQQLSMFPQLLCCQDLPSSEQRGKLGKAQGAF